MTLIKTARGRNNGTETPYRNSGSTMDVFPSVFESFMKPFVGNNAISDFFDDAMHMSQGSIGTTLPAVNISESDNDILIDVAAPGMNKKDFRIEVRDNQLHIGYRKEENKERNETNEWRKEFSFQSFERVFSLPSIVDGDSITANYTDGILRLTIPKKEEARKKPARQIEIQ